MIIFPGGAWPSHSEGEMVRSLHVCRDARQVVAGDAVTNIDNYFASEGERSNVIAIAGWICGLAAIGLGVWWVASTRHATPAADPYACRFDGREYSLGSIIKMHHGELRECLLVDGLPRWGTQFNTVQDL